MANPHPPPGGGVWRRRIALLKARKVFQLYIGHYGTYQDIADHPQVRLSKGRVGQIIQEGMLEASSELKELRAHTFDLRLMNIREMKMVARQAMLRPCPVCRGNTSELGWEPCEVCADTGYFYEHCDRMHAADRLLRAMQEEAKLLGEYPAEQKRLNVTVDADLLQRMASLPEDELDEIIEMYGPPVSVSQPLELEPRRT
jgi:hypothetical protein